MAVSEKYGQIDILGIPDDEPVFIIRAKDALAVPATQDYLHRAVKSNCNEEFVTRTGQSIELIAEWQNANQDRVKVPD